MGKNKTRRILITARVNPDLDGTSCTLAYADLLNQTGYTADGIVTGNPQGEVRYFVQEQNISIPLRSDKNSGVWENFVLVDASSMKDMPKVIKADKVIEVIDHRTGTPEKEFPKAKIQNELIGAAATIVVERFIKVGIKIKPDLAKLLYGAIFHNTLNFIASNTSKRDKDAVKYLEDNYGLNTKMIREMFDFSTKEVEANIKTSIESDAKEFGTNWKIGAFQLIVWGSEVLNKKELIEKSVNEIQTTMGFKWSFLNIIDLESKKGHLFVTSPEAADVFTRALNVSFSNGWVVLDKALLRKQIIPKIAEVYDLA